MNKLNIFIDTNILYSDPFWSNNIATLLLKAAREGTINIFISEVVLMELRHHNELNFDEAYSSLQRLDKISPRFKEVPLPNKQESLSYFDEFYNDLISNKTINILECKDEFLRIILEKAIKRLKPFSENKTELKDALIWHTYSKYANERDLKHCIFLTTNTKDFCEKGPPENGLLKIHQDLKKECDRFQVFNSLQNFQKNHIDWFKQPTHEMEQWIKEQNINESYVFEAIRALGDEMLLNLKSYLSVYGAPKFFNGVEIEMIYKGGRLEVNNMELIRCENIQVAPTEDYALVSGTLIIYAETLGYKYVYFKMGQPDNYNPFIGESNKQIELGFNFKLKKGEKPKDIEFIV